MLIGALALCAFTVVAFLPELPSLTVVVSGLAAVVLLFLVFQRQSWLLVITIFLLFMVRALSWGQEQLDQRLAFEYESVDVVIEGYVDGLPDNGDRQQRFNFKVTNAYLPSGVSISPFPNRIRLSHYLHYQQKIERPGNNLLAKGGDGWRLLVRLKRPNGFANPGGFDYELWLMSRGIGASGYVREWTQPIINDSLPARVHRWRECIRGNFSERLQGSRILGVALALAVGDKSLIDTSDNQLIRQAGLSHLLAISGLHISLVAGFGFLFGRAMGGGLAVLLPLRSFGPQVGVVCALLLAGTYALLAGFGIPTQRALIMLAVWSLWFLSSRYYSPWVSWWLSMAMVLWLQPLSILQAGFWLSFSAVAALIFLSRSSLLKERGKIAVAIYLQLGLFCLLSVVQLYWGLGVNPWSMLINLVAIPYVSFLVIPSLLLALLLGHFYSPLGYLLLSCARGLLDGFWQALDLLSHSNALTYYLPQRVLTGSEMIVCVVAVLLVFLPLNRMVRISAGVFVSLWLLQLLLHQPVNSVRPDRITFLDVGQGLAVLVESGDKAMLYDTGPRFSDDFDAGRAVILPLLKSRGLVSLDDVIISHNDTDHRGGYYSIASELPIARTWFGQPPPAGETSCNQTQSWVLGGFTVAIIGLDESRVGGSEKPNNLSCVVLIERDGFRLLLPGDIESGREIVLLEHPLLQLPVDLVAAPHHGSKTSSSIAWVEQLKPRWVVFNSGYKNRYHHPHRDVVARYRHAGSTVLCSSDSGAITFQFSGGGAPDVSRYRNAERRYWRKLTRESCG